MIDKCTDASTSCFRTKVLSNRKQIRTEREKCLITATNAAQRLAAWRRQNGVRKGEEERGSLLDVSILVGRGSGMYDGTVKDELAELILVKDPC